LIDGYNLLMRWRRGGIRSGPGNLERARDALVAWLERRLVDQQATIVFDAPGSARKSDAVRRAGPLQIVFAVDARSADEWILSECRKPNAATTTVVTNDWSIQAAARRAGARVLSTDDFLLDLCSPAKSPAASTRQATARPEKPELSPEESTRLRDEWASSTERVDRRPCDGPSSPNAEPNGPAEREKVDFEVFYRDMRAADVRDDEDGF